MEAKRPLLPLAVFSVLLGAFSPTLLLVRIEERFSYATETIGIQGKAAPSYAVSADAAGAVRAVRDGFETTGEITLERPAGSFVLSVPESFAATTENDLRIVFSAGDRSEVRTLDLESPKDGFGRPGFFTEPAVFPPTGKLSYRILSKRPLPAGTAVQATDVRSKAWRISIDADVRAAAAAPGGDPVVRRADWGADEEWRFEDSATWKPYFDKLAAEAGSEPSPETVAYREKIAKIESHLKANFPEQYGSVETIAEENGRKLVWPIEKSKKVEKIVLHHTAENNLKDLSDEELLRSTYRYHAVSRGWGDIGYNFVVGQRGRIYEGRAGGDYVVAAHAAWNNRSTVGVSVIGNFEVEHLNADQERGLKSVLETLSKKYGVDFSKTSFSHRECKKGGDCVMDDYETKNLVGHRDVGYTTCPGANLYEAMKKLRDGATYSFGLKPVENPRAKVLFAASSNPSKNLSKTEALPTLPKGPNVRVRLSYPESPSVQIEGVFRAPRFGAGTLSGSLKKNVPLTVEANGSGSLSLVLESVSKTGKPVKKRIRLGSVAFFESDVLRVKSWTRKPAWDKTGNLNDNTFRGKIEIRAENGKITLINELPLESYLKGLGEVSNGDHAEKVKTILVAARSYAYFYLQKENRKFPGKPYDASDDPEVFQKYLGYGLETRSPAVAKLADETNGEMIFFSGGVIKPWYFNESDGKVLSYREYCLLRVDNGTLPKNTECKDVPYLMGAVDPGGIGHTRKGHGVGISGIGATYFATTLDWKYPQIIRYYLDGTEVGKAY